MSTQTRPTPAAASSASTSVFQDAAWSSPNSATNSRHDNASLAAAKRQPDADDRQSHEPDREAEARVPWHEPFFDDVAPRLNGDELATQRLIGRNPVAIYGDLPGRIPGAIVVHVPERGRVNREDGATCVLEQDGRRERDLEHSSRIDCDVRRRDRRC